MTDYLYFILGVLILFLFRRTLIAEEIEQSLAFQTEAEKHSEPELVVSEPLADPQPEPVLLTHHVVYLPARINGPGPFQPLAD